jgi:hypothetical protein
MTVFLFTDSKFTLVTLLFISHAVKIFITCRPLVDFRHTRNIHFIQSSVIWSKHIRLLPKEKYTTCTYITGPDGGSKKPTKLRKRYLLTLLFVWIGKKYRYSEFYSGTSWTRSRNTSIQRKNTSEITEVNMWGVRKVVPPLKYFAQVVWPWSGTCPNLFNVSWASVGHAVRIGK